MRNYPWLKWLSFFSLLLFVLYQAGPFIAAALKIGDRHGPVIYDKDRYSAQYKMAHEVIHGNQSRLTLGLSLSDRPYFYGLERRPKPKQEREEIIKSFGDLPVHLRQQLEAAHAAMGD